MVTLLLDLDDTLLINNSDTFVEAYLKAWGNFIAPYYEPRDFIRALWEGTRQVESNLDPGCNLRQVFDSAFYPFIHSDPDKFRPLEEAFYSQIFPALREFTRPVEGVVEIVQRSFERGYQVAIATNPYFPLTAIEQRLEWAGLPVADYPFALVPSIETFHFGKPHVAFFAELLAQLGWPEGQVVMVGDDLERDILSARQLGISTYWVTGKPNKDGKPQSNLHAQGSMNELLEWLENLEDQPSETNIHSPAALLANLRSTPAALHKLCSDYDESDWIFHPEVGEWCPAEIICHLRDVDNEVNIPRIQTILEEDNPFIQGMDTDVWIEERQYRFQDGQDALWGFIQSRKQILELLAGLQADQWKRIARHSIFGRTELDELAGFIVSHDRLHIKQIFQVQNSL